MLEQNDQNLLINLNIKSSLRGVLYSHSMNIKRLFYHINDFVCVRKLIRKEMLHKKAFKTKCCKMSLS